MNQIPVITIFGITGDLSKRKLLPALYHLFANNILPKESIIIGASRNQLSKEDLTQLFKDSVINAHENCSDDILNLISHNLKSLQIDPNNLDDFTKLKTLIDSLGPKNHFSHLFYMSIPPSAYEPIINNLSRVGLNTQQDRILLEKPFGYNLASAETTIQVVHEAYEEDQIYRIDHYLAKETAQNLLTFRKDNPLFVPLWNCDYISRVHVRQFETIGIEGRVNFYEQTGALRDMVQSHLLQILALTLMDIPKDLSSQAIHEAKQDFFEKIMPADPQLAIRGQYSSYKHEVANPDSQVETYVKLKLNSQSKNWQQTDIIIEHGKGMSENIADVSLYFKSTQYRLRNKLTFRLQPNEGINLDLIVKKPGLTNEIEHAPLSFSYKGVFRESPRVEAYEKVIMEAINGDRSLFASDQEVLTTWRILQPILDYWQDNSADLKIYRFSEKP